MTRHVWTDALEEAEENRYTYGIREYYKLRKETIERDFALAKELHGFRYTQEYGQARMEWKAALTFACINLKKLAKKRWKENGKPLSTSLFQTIFSIFLPFPKKMPSEAQAKDGICRRSERAIWPACLCGIMPKYLA